METFLLSTQNIRYGGKVGRMFSVFLAEMCLECSGGTTHTDVFFEHTKQAFWWEIINVFVGIKNMFWVFKWVSR